MVWQGELQGPAVATGTMVTSANWAEPAEDTAPLAFPKIPKKYENIKPMLKLVKFKNTHMRSLCSWSATSRLCSLRGRD